MDQLLLLENVTKKFNRKDSWDPVIALDKVNFEVEKGDIYGFAGVNGAGKTTGIKAILGLCTPDEGTVKVFGDLPENCAPERIGFAPEIAELPAFMSPQEFLEFSSDLLGVGSDNERIEEVLAKTGLKEVRYRRIKFLSKGMKQRLSLAAAIIHKPELLIMDEPTSGLDPRGRKLVKDILLDLNEKGVTIFFSTHILSDIQEICTSCAVIHKGCIVFKGRIEELFGMNAVPETIFDDLISEFEAERGEGNEDEEEEEVEDDDL